MVLGKGRDDGYHCDVQSSGVNLFFVEGSFKLHLFHPLVIYHRRYRKQISCVVLIYQTKYNIDCKLWQAYMVANIQNHKVAIFSATLKRKTRIGPFAYYLMLISFEMVACDVGILYCIESLHDRLWTKEDVCDFMQHADIKGNHFNVN